jgi:hypothetical protein
VLREHYHLLAFRTWGEHKIGHFAWAESERQVWALGNRLRDPAFRAELGLTNIVDALVQGEVAYWNPSNVRAGASLSDQLRDGYTSTLIRADRHLCTVIIKYVLLETKAG